MGTSHKIGMMTAAVHQLMVFLPNLTMARIENENAARFHSLATTPVAKPHRYTLHRYSGKGECVLTALRTVAVHATNSEITATRSPASRRLMRKRRTGLGTAVAIRSAKIVSTIRAPATAVVIANSIE